jgi:hypothetical protein
MLPKRVQLPSTRPQPRPELHDSIRRPNRLRFGLLCLVSLPGFGIILSRFLLLRRSALPRPMPHLATVVAVALAALLLALGPRSCESIISSGLGFGPGVFGLRLSATVFQPVRFLADVVNEGFGVNSRRREDAGG